MKDYVYGLNKSGLSVIKLLKTQNKDFDCWDDSEKTRFSLKKKICKFKFNSNKKNKLKKI